MGHLAHLRNSSNQKAHLQKSNDSIDKERKNIISFLRIVQMVLICKILNYLHQVWLKLPQWFWRCRFFCQCIFFFLIISPWETMGPFYLNKLKSPSPKDVLCNVWLKLTQLALRRRWWKSEKFTDKRTGGRTDRRTDGRTTDNRRSVKLTWAFSSGEIKVLKPFYDRFC